MSWGYQGRVNYERYTNNIVQAIKRGKFKHKKTNTNGTFDGTGSVFWAFDGHRLDAKGVFAFYHYNKCVLEFDTVHRKCTDHGWSSYSRTTSANISSWARRLLQAIDREGAFTYKTYWWPQWTNPAPGWLVYGYRELWHRFRDGLPWVEKVETPYGTSYWIKIDQLDPDAGEVIWGSIRDLRKGARHWFTYDWNEQGQWVKKYKDDAAKTRHEAYIRRVERRQKKALEGKK